MTAQLIKADDGFHLWSENYDRELTNIFAIQDEIAGSIAEALKVSLNLNSGAAGNLTGTQSIEAYEHYLKGMSLWHQRTVPSLNQAIDEFNVAISLDPGFAKAHAGLAITWSVIAGYVITIDSRLSQANTADAANRALSLDPENVEATVALGGLARDQFRLEEAASYFERAIELNPSFATAHQWYGGLLLDMGEPEAAALRSQQAWTLDPRSGIIGTNYALILEALGRRQDAIAVVQNVINFSPDFPEALRAMISLSIYTGDCEAVAQYGTQLVGVLKKNTNSVPVYLDLCQSENPGLREKAIQTMLSWDIPDFSSPDDATLSYPQDLVLLLIDLGEFESALIMTDKYKEYYSNYVLTQVRSNRTVNGIKFYCDPRVLQLIEESGVPPMNNENICD